MIIPFLKPVQPATAVSGSGAVWFPQGLNAEADGVNLRAWHSKTSTTNKTAAILRKRKKSLVTRSSRFSLSHSGLMPIPLPPLGLAELFQRTDDLMKSDLLYWRDFWFTWAAISTGTVVAGLFGELPELGHELKSMWHRYEIRGDTISLNEPSESNWIKQVAFIGWLLIVLGVAGELGTTVMLSRADAALEAFNTTLLAETNKEAGSAKASAEIADWAASRARDQSDKATASAWNALALASSARREMTSVHQEVGKAASQLTQLEAEAKKTESDLINLALCTAPRVISNWHILGAPGTKSYVDSLLPMAGQLVFIEVVPDAEARRAALNIARTLGDAQWNVQKPLRFVDGLADGVSVQPSNPPVRRSEKGEIPLANMSAYWHAEDAARKLLEFLHSYDWQATRGWPTDLQGAPIRDEKVLPAGAIRIQVGLYPAAVYVSPPGQKEFTSSIEQMKREQDADIKRRREEALAALPPELRKRREQEMEEWDAKTKSAMSNGPCQVLNPLF